MSSGYRREFSDISVTLASVAIAVGSNSLIDRLANALSADTVFRTIYEVSRTLDSIAPAGREIQVRQDRDDVVIKTEDGVFRVHGKMASPDRIETFLDQASKDTQIARSVAAHAMYLVAMSKRKASSSGTDTSSS